MLNLEKLLQYASAIKLTKKLYYKQAATVYVWMKEYRIFQSSSKKLITFANIMTIILLINLLKINRKHYTNHIIE